MATIRRGKRAGQEVEILQFCNDWFQVKLPDGMPHIVGVTGLVLTDPEIHRIVMDADAGNTGMMFREFELDYATRTFKRKAGR